MGNAFAIQPLDAADLRWTCDTDRFQFETTAEIEARDSTVGQDAAIESLQFGLETNAPGQHIFVRGLEGTGRSTTIRRLLTAIRPPCKPTADRCFVHNFVQTDRPRLLNLPHGRGREFCGRIDDLIALIVEKLPQELTSDPMNSRVAALEKKASAEIDAWTGPFEDELKQAELTLVVTELSGTARPAVVPLIDGKPAPPEQFDALCKAGTLDPDKARATLKQIEVYADRLESIGDAMREIHAKKVEAIETLIRSELRTFLVRFTKPIEGAFPEPEIATFLQGIVEDLTEKRIHNLDSLAEFVELYRVNVVLHHETSDCPMILDHAPSFPELLGSVDWAEVGEDGPPRPPHMLIRAGSLLRADGGYLILEARDVLEEPGAWKALVRTLRTGTIELTPPELPGPWRVPMLRPDPIPVQVKIVMLGDPGVYPTLEALDPDFANLFKVLADFDSVIPRDEEGIESYAHVLARLAREENLLPFDRTGVAALCEHGARIAAQRGKLTSRFGRLADLAREAAFVCGKRNAAHVTRDDVEQSIRRTKRRAALPSRRFGELVASGIIRIATRGAEVGQINGLAVMQAGPLTYGVPTRITATIGPGTAGAINIEREADLSGAIHTKGFYILGGLLRHLLRTEHPLAFDASVAFEQSYGGIDGDSASAAEVCCLLSALTEIPLRLDLAMTGAIDQMGNILPVGAANEKIEGFFDACMATELTGTQGVVIPAANAGDLMLRHDVVEACAAGRFSVYAVESIHQALGICTGVAPGELDKDGCYPSESVLGRAVCRAGLYWDRVGGIRFTRPDPRR